jgi:orotate phosphoribosyltransferase
MDQLKLELKSAVSTEAVKTGPEFTLSSGQKSTTFVNCKTISLNGPRLKLCSQVLWGEAKKIWGPLNSVAGVSIGGDPLVAGIAIEAFSLEKANIHALIVRKEAKDHGATKGLYVEGVNNTVAGPCVLIEDVVSTGASSIEGAKRLIDAGYNLKGILSIVDREMGGLENIKEATNLPAHALFNLSQLIDAP